MPLTRVLLLLLALWLWLAGGVAAQESPLPSPSPAQAPSPEPSSPPNRIPPRGVRGHGEQWRDVRTVEALEQNRQERLQERREQLRRFGESFFSNAREELTSSGEGLVPADYRLITGDQLEASIYNVQGGGSVETLTIDEAGVVYLPGVGPLGLAGLTRYDAEARLNAALAQKLPNMRVRLRLVKAAKIRVFLLGEIAKPGGYLVNPGATVLDGLLRAGGPSASGSYRRAELQRNGRVVATFDLYDVLIRGKTASPRLSEGDRIFVPLAGTQVYVSGQVHRPAIYELLREKTLGEVLVLAGGIKPEAYSPHAQIERVAKNVSRILLDVPLSKKSTPVLAGDFILIKSVLDDLSNGVYLAGAVERPGWYQLRPGMRVADLLREAEGVRGGAYAGHAELFRRERPERPVQMLGLDLSRALAGDPANNLVLRSEDRLVIYERSVAQFDSDRVRIQGEVTNPGEYPRFENMRVRDLLLMAGGVTPQAAAEAEIARPGPGGQLELIALNVRNALDSPQSPDNLEIRPLDVMIIRQEYARRLWPASVRLVGEFARPGVYSIDPGRETLQSLIQRAGGLTAAAYPRAAVFTRETPAIIRPGEKKLVKEVYDNLADIAKQIAVAEMVRQSAVRLPTGQVQRPSLSAADTVEKQAEAVVPEIIDRVLATSRIPVDLVTPGAGDPGLKDGDVLYMPTRPTTVVVSGAVKMPAPYVWEEGRSLEGYLARAGGITREAEEDDTVVLRANGELVQASLARVIEPGDLILVPPKAIIASPSAFEDFLSTLQVLTNGLFLSRFLSR